MGAVVLVLSATATTFGSGIAGAQSAEAFRNGEAEASAETFSLNIKQGNANIGFTYGRSLANYRDTTGTSEARALDLGVLPTLFGVEQCDGSPPLLDPATITAVTRVDSTDPAAPSSRRTEAYQPGLGQQGPGPSAGYQDATASPLPSATGVTESARADMWILALDGGRTEVDARLVDGVREAHAVSTADELRVFGGLFTFTEPRWEATARSGATTSTQGGFSFERATVMGIQRDPLEAMRDLAGFEKGLEDLLAPLGVQFDLPTVRIDGGRVTVTPMAFRVENMPWGAEVIAPFLGRVQPLKESLTAQLLAEDCTNESSLLLLDVILGIVAGSGSVELMAGGVDVLTLDTDFSSPPLAPLPVDGFEAPVEVPPTDPMTTDLSAGDLAFDDRTLDDIGFDTVDTSLDTGPDTEFVAEVAGTVEEPEENEVAIQAAPASRFEDSAAGAAAVAVGVVGLLGALALCFGERLMSRRTTRRIP